MSRREPPHGYADNGMPIWAFNEKGDPVCGYQTKHGPCQQTILNPKNGRCHNRVHGGQPRGEDHPGYKHGKFSLANLERKAMLDKIAAYKPKGAGVSTAEELAVQNLWQLLEEGDPEMTRFFLDKRLGPAPTKASINVRALVSSLSNEELLELLNQLESEVGGGGS